MPISRSIAISLCCGLLIAACSKTTGGQTGDEDALPANEFYAGVARQQGFGNYPAAVDLGDLVERSARVVQAHAVALRVGRRFVVPSGGSDTSTIETIVLELAVDRTLKGLEQSALYLEFVVGNAEEQAAERVPHDAVLAFAVRATEHEFFGETIEGAGDGLPAGEQLYQLTTPQGFVLDGDNGFSQPFERNDDALGHGDFDDLVARTAAAVAGGVTSDASIADGGSAEPDGSAAGSDAGSCRAEASRCPAMCAEVGAIPYDDANACLDYGAGIVVGCLDGVGPPVTVCIVRVSDGARFMVGQGWPFPESSAFQTCADDVSNMVLTAQSCP